MKKIILLLSLIIFNSCDKKEKPVYEFMNKEQQNFVNFYNESDYIIADNEIQKEEISNKFYKKIDSISEKLKVNNWEGKISDIKINELGKSSELSFIISFDISESEKITFKTSYLLDNDKKQNDSFYNKVKKIADFSTVYFDGFIQRDLSGNTVYFNEDKFGHESLILDKKKDFCFNTINLSTEKTKDFSKNLINYNNISDDIFKILDDKLSGKIKENKWEIETQRLVEKSKKIKLTKEENEIAETYKKYLYFKFMGLI